MDESRALIENEGQLLQKDLAAYAVQAQQSGNIAAASEARQLSRRLELSIRRVSRFSDPGERRGFPGTRPQKQGDKPRRGESGQE